MKNGDMPAYPQSYEKDETRAKIMEAGLKVKGMTKREAFAMAAMQGIIANDGGGPPDVAHRAVVMADELLKQLES